MKLFALFTAWRGRKPVRAPAMTQDFLGFLMGLYHAQGIRVPADLPHWEGDDTRTYKLAYEAVKPAPATPAKKVLRLASESKLAKVVKPTRTYGPAPRAIKAPKQSPRRIQSRTK